MPKAKHEQDDAHVGEVIGGIRFCLARVETLKQCMRRDGRVHGDGVAGTRNYVAKPLDVFQQKE